jgi:hypothetical protein
MDISLGSGLCSIVISIDFFLVKISILRVSSAVVLRMYCWIKEFSQIQPEIGFFQDHHRT